MIMYKAYAASALLFYLFILTPMCLLVNDALEFDEMDFDEPMEVQHEEEEKPAVKEEPALKAVTPEISVKAVPKVELQDPVLM